MQCTKVVERSISYEEEQRIVGRGNLPQRSVGESAEQWYVRDGG